MDVSANFFAEKCLNISLYIAHILVIYYKMNSGRLAVEKSNVLTAKFDG